jgi:hypothetical protein
MMVATQHQVDAHGWAKVLLGAPDSDRNVLVWDSIDAIPVTAYFEEDEKSWYGIGGGRDLTEAVTHWREIEAPEGVAV